RGRESRGQPTEKIDVVDLRPPVAQARLRRHIVVTHVVMDWKCQISGDPQSHGVERTPCRRDRCGRQCQWRTLTTCCEVSRYGRASYCRSQTWLVDTR